MPFAARAGRSHLHPAATIATAAADLVQLDVRQAALLCPSVALVRRRSRGLDDNRLRGGVQRLLQLFPTHTTAAFIATSRGLHLGRVPMAERHKRRGRHIGVYGRL